MHFGITLKAQLVQHTRRFGKYASRIYRFFYNENYEKYTNWHPAHDKKCAKCELLPLCAGGCPARFARETNNPLQYGNCSQTKDTLIGHLINYLKLENL
ncbi:MAG: SPASM domain-containing protein [Lentisphaeria bacterium]|nr:SPASM domain-containing protein [Lentisphaeria bacterium]